MTEQQIRTRRRVNLEPTESELAAAKAQEQTVTQTEAPPVTDVHEGFILVRRAAYGQEEEAQETVRVPLFSSQVARIRVSAGSTRNLGDYNSARVEVTIELPCYPVESEVNRAYNQIEAWLDEIIPLELAKAGVAEGA